MMPRNTLALYAIATCWLVQGGAHIVLLASGDVTWWRCLLAPVEILCALTIFWQAVFEERWGRKCVEKAVNQALDHARQIWIEEHRQ